MNRSLPAFRPMQSVLFEKPTVERATTVGLGLQSPSLKLVSLVQRAALSLLAHHFAR